jgi:hypothetical protein
MERAMSDYLTSEQRAVADKVVAEQGAARDHLVVYLSGSHAYGFPSPDSDLDIKAVHALPAAAFLGLERPALAADFLRVIDGVEVDYTSNELGAVLAGVLGGNGNYIERILGSLVLATSEIHGELRELATGALSRRVYRHYAGFARNQREALERAAAPTAKKILYVLRTALTGAHLLQTGELITDVAVTAGAQGIDGVAELIEVKKAGERTALAPGMLARWTASLDRAMERLEAGRDGSPLPIEPANAAEVDAWLIDYRLTNDRSR